MTTVTCDLAVIGDHLGAGRGALACAGRRVILFETQETDEGRPLEYLNASPAAPSWNRRSAASFQELGRSPSVRSETTASISGPRTARCR